MGRERPRGLILDTGALIAFEAGDRRLRDLVSQAVQRELPMVIPAGVLAQAWREGARQARLAGVLSHSLATVDRLDTAAAKAAGVLCGRTGTRDVVDASVVISARSHGAVVITSDPADISAIDPTLVVHGV